MIHIRSNEEIEIIRKSALMVTATLTKVASFLKPGITTLSIDKMAEQFIRDNGGVPSFKGYGSKNNAFPFSLCISINDVVVHGFPSSYELKDGDIVSVDCGVYMNGYHGDHAYTFAIGDVPAEYLKLMRVTKESLVMAVAEAHEGNRVGDISYTVENQCNKINGYGVVRDLVGHGVGKQLHEDPQVPNYGRRGDGKRLKEGMVLAIEPMINMGTHKVFTDDDGWTVRTQDGKVSVHFEHDVCVKAGKALILSDFSIIEAAEKANINLNTSYY
jgi:methionyl aminopeptidase